MTALQERTPQQYEELGRMTQALLHNINNSLASIVGFAEFLTEDLEEGTQAHLFATNIGKSGEHLKEMVRQLWTINNLTNTPHDGMVERADLGEAIETILLQLSEPVSKNMGIHMDFDIHPDIENTTITGHQGYLSIALLQLINNAIEAFAEKSGDENKNIMISLEPATGLEGALQLSIKDNGKGMEKELLDQCQTPFFSTKDPSEHHGLGLTMARHILKSAGADLIIESEPGHGTNSRIIFRIPEKPAKKSHP